MKIAFAIFRYFPWGGLQRDFLRLAQEIANRGHEVTCFTGKWEGAEPAFAKVEVIPLHSKTNHGRAEEFEKVFQERIKDGAFDRTITFNRIGGADFYFAGDDCYATTFAARRNPFLRFLPRYKVFLRQEKNIFTWDAATKILHLSERQKTDYIRKYGTQEERFFMLPPAGDPRCVLDENAVAYRAQRREELRATGDQVLLLSVAADFHCKGVDRTIRAVASLPKDMKERIVLCLIGGKDMSRRKKFMRLADKMGIGEITVFPGPRENVHEYLAAADLMVHPARKEATGTVLAEALAMGLPAICTEICGFEFLLRKAKCPVVPEPFDDLTFSTILEKAINDLETLSAGAKSVAGDLDFRRRQQTAADLILGPL